ncbi:MAG TPA: hypothetical protein VFR70_05615 [Flavobacterium sp.]|nr:hypothetical protein [Flavobacterium sp.]
MTKIICFLTILILTATALQAQEKNQTQTKGIQYSFLWGAFKSKGYKGKNFDFQFDTSKEEKNSHAGNLYAVDTTKYIEKRLFWGAIQWTEKKEQSKAKTDKP